MRNLQYWIRIWQKSHNTVPNHNYILCVVRILMKQTLPNKKLYNRFINNCLFPNYFRRPGWRNGSVIWLVKDSGRKRGCLKFARDRDLERIGTQFWQVIWLRILFQFQKRWFIFQFLRKVYEYGYWKIFVLWENLFFISRKAFYTIQMFFFSFWKPLKEWALKETLFYQPIFGTPVIFWVHFLFISSS